MRVGRVDVGQRSETVHRANLSAIVRDLHERGPLSRSELVAATGLTRSAIRALVGELAAAGLVFEERPVPLGTPGRPSPLVRLNPDGAAVLSLEILVDSIAVAIVGLGGQTLERIRVERPRVELSVDDVVADLAALVGDLPVRDDRPIVGIGVAVAGVVRRSDGLVSMAPNLGWIDVPLGARLARALATAVPIAVMNDADAGVLGEARRGAAVGVDNVLYVSGEVGVGGGMIVDGRLLTGVAGFAGEIGHLTVNPEGRPCRCGSVGCWETEVGEGMLLALAGYPADAGRSGIDAVLREAEAGSGVRDRGARPRRPLAGHRPRRPDQHPQPAAGDPGRARMPACTRSSAARSRPSSTGTRCRRPVRWSASSRRPSASTPRSSAPPRWPSSPCSPIPRPGSAAPATRFTWRAPDVGARIRSIERIDRRQNAATGVKGVCLTM